MEGVNINLLVKIRIYNIKMLNVARRKIKEFHLNCDTAVLVHIGKEKHEGTPC